MCVPVICHSWSSPSTKESRKATIIYWTVNDIIWVIIMWRNKRFLDMNRFVFPPSISKYKLRLVDFNLWTEIWVTFKSTEQIFSLTRIKSQLPCSACSHWKEMGFVRNNKILFQFPSKSFAMDLFNLEIMFYFTDLSLLFHILITYLEASNLLKMLQMLFWVKLVFSQINWLHVESF